MEPLLSQSGSTTATPTACIPLLQPEKEPLQFDVCSAGLPPESAALLHHIQQVAESALYHWKSFPIVLPPPLAVQWDSQEYGCPAESRTTKPLVVHDAFIPPSFDELDAVAVDSKGDPKQLEAGHLSTIRETGQFRVPSLHFPQQEHVWQVSQWLQKGRQRALDSLLDDAAAAAAVVAVVARDRLTGDCFSLLHAAHSLWTGLVMVVDLLVGVPWLSSEHLQARLQEERCTHLVQELTAEDGAVAPVCAWLEQQVRRSALEKVPVSRGARPALPYVFSTPQGLLLDLRLHNSAVVRAAVPLLVSVLEKESRGWFLHFRERTVARLRAQGLHERELERAACLAVQDEYLRRVCAAISSHPALQQLAGPGTSALLCQHATAVTIMNRAVSDAQAALCSSSQQQERDLRARHPVLARSRRWREGALKSRRRPLLQQHRWRPHQQALEACREAGLHQHAYFIQRDLAFMRERAPVLQKELQSLKVPTREFEWRAQIMRPQRYVVRRTFQGSSEVIPTVLSSVPTSITAPRTPHQPGYVLQKDMAYVSSTRWPLWRVFNLFLRSWSWTCNAVFLFGVWLPLCSPFSLRALLASQPFMPDYELSQVNGSVCPSRASLTPTLSHRLHHLWRRIAKARTHFETTPDTGFIGKGVSRHLNRAYNYVVKGALGTLLLVLLFPLISVAVSLASFVVALLAPLWVPCVVLTGSIVAPLVYDIDAPVPGRRWAPYPLAVGGHLLLGGVVQPLLVVAVLLLCPVMAAVWLAAGVVRYCVRSAWDWLMFELVIRRRGRVPAADSCLVKRVAGPGLHHHYSYQISSEQALVAFEGRLEQELLLAHQRKIEEHMAQPLRAYDHFLSTLFAPFSGGCAGSSSSGGHERVVREVRELHRALHDRVEARRRELQLGLPSDIRTRLKLTTRELKATLKAAVVMLEQFYPSTLFPLILAPHCGVSSEQQSRIDSGISTGGELEEGVGSRGSLVGGDLLPPEANGRPANGGSRSLAGHGKNLAGSAAVRQQRQGSRQGDSAGVSRAQHSQSQHLTFTRGRSDDSCALNASEGACLDAPPTTIAGLQRGMNSFDCEMGLGDEGRSGVSESASRGRSEDRLLLSESREVLLAGRSGRGDSEELSLVVSGRVVTSPPPLDGEGGTAVLRGAAAAGRNGLYPTEEAWWDSRGLQPGDYASLAAILFTEIFSPDFLTPMDDDDTAFQIEVSGVSLRRYSVQLRQCPPRPDLDAILPVHAPTGGGRGPNVPPPYLDLTCFSPTVRLPAATAVLHRPVAGGSATARAALWGTSIAQRLSLRARPEGGAESERVTDCALETPLVIPPPVPHPAAIAVIIHNREALEPIPLCSADTQRVLRCLEDSSNDDGEWSSASTPGESSDTPDSSPPTSPPSLYEGAAYSQADGGTSRCATLPLSAALDASPDAVYSPRSPHNPLRSLLESGPPFSVSLDLAPPEDPPEDDYDDTLRTRHAIDAVERIHGGGGHPTHV